MKKIILALSGVFGVFMAGHALAENHSYDKGSRTISVVFDAPVQQAKVFLSGYNLAGKCARDMSVMKLVPSKTHNHSNTVGAQAGVGASAKALSGNIGVSGSSTHGVQYSEPQKYEFNYNGLLRKLHYTIVYRRDGKDYEVKGGWSGHDFPCNYQVPLN